MTLPAPTISDFGHCRGFALLELMVALAVVSLIGVLALPDVVRRLADDRERSVTRIICSYAALGQLQALNSGVSGTVEIGSGRSPACRTGPGNALVATGLAADSVSANQQAWQSSDSVSIIFAPPFGSPYGGGTLSVGERRSVVVRVASGLTSSRVH